MKTGLFSKIHNVVHSRLSATRSNTLSNSPELDTRRASVRDSGSNSWHNPHGGEHSSSFFLP